MWWVFVCVWQQSVYAFVQKPMFCWRLNLLWISPTLECAKHTPSLRNGGPVVCTTPTGRTMGQSPWPVVRPVVSVRPSYCQYLSTDSTSKSQNTEHTTSVVHGSFRVIVCFNWINSLVRNVAANFSDCCGTSKHSPIAVVRIHTNSLTHR